MKKLKLKKEVEVVDDFVAKMKELSDLEFKAGEKYKGVAFKKVHKILTDNVRIHGHNDVYIGMTTGTISRLKGIGSSTVNIINEYMSTGHIKRLEELRLEVNAREEVTVPKSYTVDALRDTIETIILISKMTITGEGRLCYERSTLGGTVSELEFVAPAHSINDYSFLNTNGLRLLQKGEGIVYDNIAYDNLVIRDKRYPQPIAIKVYRVHENFIGAILLGTTGPKNFTKYIQEEAINQGMYLTPFSGIIKDNKAISTLTEEDAFEVLGLGYIPCCLR